VLYNYFADKNDLLLAALVQRYGRVAARFDVDLPAPGTATVEANLIAYARATLGLIAEGLPIAAGLISDPPLLHRFVEAIHHQPFGPQRVRQPLVAYLIGEQRLGRVAAMDVDAVFPLLFGATVILAFASLMGGRPREDLAEQLPAIVGTLVRGLDPRPPPLRPGVAA
jgi:AcrR family transcriptional regulator